MDFQLDEDQQALSDLAATIFADLSQPARCREIEKTGGFDADLWKALAAADLLGVAIPEADGGADLGLVGLCALLEQAGRRTALVPLWSVLTTALAPLVEFGTPEQKAQWVPRILRGEAIVVGAFGQLQDGSLPLVGIAGGSAHDHGHEESNKSWTISGEVIGVPAAPHADAFVLPFRVGDHTHVALVRASAPGIAITPITVTSRESAGILTITDLPVTAADLLENKDDQLMTQVRTVSAIGQAALAVGVCSEAVAMSADYTSQRVQFGRPLSTNQGIAMRLADAHLDTERIRLTTYNAAWQVDSGHAPEYTGPATLVASWWAKEGTTRVVYATQHVHGGIGGDVDYPIHRYLIWGKQIALTNASAAATQAALGAVIEQAPRIGASR